VIRRRDTNAFVKSATPWPIVLLARSLGLGGSERQLTEVAMALDRRFAPTCGGPASGFWSCRCGRL